MKIFFLDTDNIFFLKNARCVSRNNNKAIILNSNHEEYEILKTIFLTKALDDEIYNKHKIFLKSLINQDIIKTILAVHCNYDKLSKTIEYLFSTQHNFTYKKLNSFQKNKVLIIGLGGTAIEVINQLIAMDFKNYVLVDFDIVNTSNLNRQHLFTKEDIGKLKVDVVAELIKHSVVDANVISYNKKIKTTEDVQTILKDEDNIDIVICCADTPPVEIQIMILEPLLKNKVAFLCSGVGINMGTIGPLIVNKKHKQRYLDMLHQTIDKLDCVTPCSASFGITNSLVSIITARECISYLLNNKPQSLNSIITINFKDLSITLKKL